MRSPDVLAHLAVSGDPTPTIDLTGLSWVTPAVMVGSAALARRAIDTGQAFAVRGPRTASAMSYLARMRFGRELSDIGVSHDVPTRSRARDRHSDLLELAPVETEADAHALAELVEANVARTDADLAARLFRSLAEVGDNVADHADAVGYMAAQKMPSRNELHIAVADGGVGLLHWLGPARGASSHTEALSMALTGLSRHTESVEAGGGIVRTLALVSEMSGESMFASGNAWSVDRGVGRRRGRSRQVFGGTIFEARIPLGRRDE